MFCEDDKTKIWGRDLNNVALTWVAMSLVVVPVIASLRALGLLLGTTNGLFGVKRPKISINKFCFYLIQKHLKGQYRHEIRAGHGIGVLV